jgi:outer membrane protein OmpA-like peptidoglycan-associated protein
MLKILSIAACGVLLLTACEQKQAVVAVSSPQTPQPARNFMVFFAYDQATLAPDNEAVVQEAAAAAKARPNARVTVAGHADTAGDAPYNQILSERRAAATKDALMRDGVNEAAITVVAHGQEELLVATKDRMREPKNRRVEIVVQ